MTPGGEKGEEDPCELGCGPRLGSPETPEEDGSRVLASWKQNCGLLDRNGEGDTLGGVTT